MAIKELFYDNRPQVLLDPRASQRIDPRFKFTRNSIGTYVGNDGLIKTAPVNQPRLEYDRLTGEALGLLSERTASNLFLYSTSDIVANYTASGHAKQASSVIAPDGSTNAVKVIANNGVLPGTPTAEGLQQSRTITSGIYKFSVFAKAGEQTSFAIREGVSAGGFFTINLLNGTYGAFGVGSNYTVTPYKNGWYRVSWTSYTDTTNLTRYRFRAAVEGDGVSGFYLWGFQAEPGQELTSLIPTTNSTGTRAADLLSVEAPLPASGSVYIDARAITANENDTLLSLKNSSNDKIDLAYLSNASTYNSLALIANYDGTSKTSLPLPVPTTARERNIITWGANNYQYTRDSSRYATSLSSSVPTGLNQLSIGHDAVDPTKAFNGYINTVYAWSGELTPAVAEALVRNDLDPIDADTYSPTGPAGSLALVINTQGATTSGDKTFTLPAESAANDNDIVITWGDGTESGLDGTDAEVGSAALTHTYPAAGIYPVWVEGQMQNIYFNNIANAPDLLQIAAWGTNANGNNVFRTPSTMANAFYGCSQMNFSTSARTTNLPDTSAVQNWSNAFNNCSSITGTFPAFNFSAATNFSSTWSGCSSLTAFTAAGDQTQNVTNFSSAWSNCSGLTSFPLINTSSATNLTAAWSGCSGLTSFPLINTSSATTLALAWAGCSSLTSFPLINTSSCVDFYVTWQGCSSLTSFPLIDTSSGIDFTNSWYGCSALTSFPLLDTGAGVTFISTWLGCAALTGFPLIDTSSATTMRSAWYSCTGLTSFPLLNTTSVTDFDRSWAFCYALAAFPEIDTSSGTNFAMAWYANNALTSFPSLNFNAVTGSASDSASSNTGFKQTWFSCVALANFPANLFDNTTCTRYLDAFNGCALTAASIENIIVSIEAAGTSNGNLSLQGGTNAGASTWTANAVTAYNALVARGWTITRNA